MNERLKCLGSAVPLLMFSFTSSAAHILMVHLLCKNVSTFHFPITLHKCLYIKVNYHDIISILTLFLFLSLIILLKCCVGIWLLFWLASFWHNTLEWSLRYAQLCECITFKIWHLKYSCQKPGYHSLCSRINNNKSRFNGINK